MTKIEQISQEKMHLILAKKSRSDTLKRKRMRTILKVLLYTCIFDGIILFEGRM